MFAALVFESGREPFRLENMPEALANWAQSYGGWAAFGLALWLLVGFTRMRSTEKARIPAWESITIAVLAVFACVAYLIVAGYAVADLVSFSRGVEVKDPALWSFRYWCLTLGGVFSIAAVLVPILRNAVSLRWRRIWGLTRLSFKEALRSRVLYVFSFLLLVFLFGGWFIPSKPEYQVRTYVWVVEVAMSVLLLATAVVLSAFSLPTDMKNQTIHTIVTKPVERFEVFLGRFFGFAGLLTLVLVVMASVSLLYVVRGVDPAAAAESLKARDPLYGDLHFEDNAGVVGNLGVNIGREWDYRSYISRAQPGQPQLLAVWTFNSVPSSLGSRPTVRCEFTFDIYRQSKGRENRGIVCNFSFRNGNYVKGNEKPYRNERTALVNKGQSVAEVDAELATKYGYFEVPAIEVVDYHTQSIDLPGALFQNTTSPSPTAPGRPPAPPLTVQVACESSQYVGMAKHDLYVRTDDPAGGRDTFWFALNFYKSSFGLWLRVSLLVGLAVALSTYFSGVISLIVALILYVCGGFTDFVQSQALSAPKEGGPRQAAMAILRGDVGTVMVAQEPGTESWAERFTDASFRFVFRRFLDVIPDTDRLDLSTYVAEGFNVPPSQVLYCFGVFLGYLVPWVVLAFYLIRWREVASTQ